MDVASSSYIPASSVMVSNIEPELTDGEGTVARSSVCGHRGLKTPIKRKGGQKRTQKTQLTEGVQLPSPAKV